MHFRNLQNQLLNLCGQKWYQLTIYAGRLKTIKQNALSLHLKLTLCIIIYLQNRLHFVLFTIIQFIKPSMFLRTKVKAKMICV